MFRRFFLTAAVAVAAGFTAPSSARADFLLSLSNGTDTSYIDLTTGTLAAGYTSSGSLSIKAGSYGNSGNSLGSGIYTAGFQSFFGSAITFDGFTIAGEFGTTNTPGSSSGSVLEIQSLTVTNNTGATGTLTVALTAQNYTLPSPQSSLSLAATAVYNTLVPGSAVSAATYYDATNSNFGESGPVASANSQSGGLGLTGVQTSTGLAGLSTTYSMTDVLTLQNMGNGQTLGVGEVEGIVSAPTPSGLILAATMVPFFGLLRRRLIGMSKPVGV